MDQMNSSRSRKAQIRLLVLKGLFFYGLVPALVLGFLAPVIRDAARISDPAAFLILLGSLTVIALNWLVYRLIHGKHPPLPVFAHGLLCLTAVAVIELEALHGNDAMTSTLAILSISLGVGAMILISFWLASTRSRPAHAICVFIRVLLGIFFFLMIWQIIRDFEARLVTRDTWLTIGILILFLLAYNGRRILSAVRRAGAQRRRTGRTEGQLVQAMGETHLDLDGDPVTMYLVRVVYTVNGILYETTADITRHTLRKYGRESIIGRKIPVCYNPNNPADGFAGRIDKEFFDRLAKEAEKETLSPVPACPGPEG